MFRKILLVIFVVGGLLALFNMMNIICYFTARSYLSAIKEGDFNSAFKHVKYYDKGIDREPEISYEMAKDIWTSRMSELKTDDIYLHDYKDLQIDTNDYGYAREKATVLLCNNGEIKELKSYIQFHAGPDKWWKIEDLSFSEPGDYVFHKSVSGYIDIERLRAES